MTTRREFVGTAAALLLPWQAAPKPPLGFSTLGCPTWPWPRILDFAAEHGFASIELRGILTNMDLTKVPELAPEHLGEAKQQLRAHGLAVSCLGASANMHDMDPVKHAAQLDEARRFIDLAHALGAPYVRVFGNELPETVPRCPDQPPRIKAKPLRTTRLSTVRQRRIVRCPHRPRRARHDGLCRSRAETFKRGRGYWSALAETQPDV